jgi:hypothetical protein
MALEIWSPWMGNSGIHLPKNSHFFKVSLFGHGFFHGSTLGSYNEIRKGDHHPSVGATVFFLWTSVLWIFPGKWESTDVETGYNATKFWNEMQSRSLILPEVLKCMGRIQEWLEFQRLGTPWDTSSLFLLTCKDPLLLIITVSPVSPLENHWWWVKFALVQGVLGVLILPWRNMIYIHLYTRYIALCRSMYRISVQARPYSPQHFWE